MAISNENKKRWNSKEWKTLTTIQNRWYPHTDIMTITDFMSDDQFIKHVDRYVAYAEDNARIEGN